MNFLSSKTFSTLEKTLLLCGLLALFGVAASEVNSFDIFWQLQSGKYMLETKSFIHRDIFTLAPDALRFEHCWLHDILFYLIYTASGYVGISLFKGALVTATAALLAAAARVRGASWTSILLLLIPAVQVTNGHWLARPQLWTYLLFAFFLLILEKHRKSGGPLLWWLVPLMLLWVNLHAGAVLAFPILAAYLVGEGLFLLFRKSTLTKRAYASLWLVLVLLLGATMVTPYGSQVLNTLKIAPSLGGARIESESSPAQLQVPTEKGLKFESGIAREGDRVGSITQLYNMDWRQVTFWRDRAFFIGLGIAAALLLLGWRRLTLTDLFLLGGLTLMGFQLYRHTPFFFMAGAALLPPYLDAAVQPVTRRLGERSRTALQAAAILAAISVAGFFFHELATVNGFFRTGLRNWNYPVQAADFVRKNHLPGTLYNTYEWGGYLEWTLYPDYRVFWDGRADSRKMFAAGLRISHGDPGWKEDLNTYNVNTLVLCPLTFDLGGRRLVLDQLRRPDSGWALVFADDSALVFVREQAVDPLWLSRNRLPMARLDDTIISMARQLLNEDPKRYKAYRELAGIFIRRKELLKAISVLEVYLRKTPEPDPEAEYYFRTLYPMVTGDPAPPISGR